MLEACLRHDDDPGSTSGTRRARWRKRADETKRSAQVVADGGFVPLRV